MFLKLYHAKRYCIMPREEPLGTTLTESVPEAFELPASDWPEKNFWPISEVKELCDSDVFLHDVGFLIDHHCCIARLTGKVS